MSLPVNEMFSTIQGEATHAGRPSLFIRLQGCPVGCPWCDTRHTWTLLAENEAPVPVVLGKSGTGTALWAKMTEAELVDFAQQASPSHVVLTGGEPCLYDLTLLSTSLIDAGRSVQLETSGTHPIKIDPRAWVTVSPKIDMPGKFMVRSDALARADEIKMPVGKPDDVLNLFHMLDRNAHRPDVPIWLQPLSLSRKATDLCVATATANNFRVSLQVHALAGWR